MTGESRVTAVYMRVSREDGDLRRAGEKTESDSIANQRSYLRQYISQRADLREAEILEFVDDGVSGVGFERPSFKRMIDMCCRAEIDCVIVKDLSRFGRNHLEAGRYLERLFPVWGVRFIAVNDQYDSGAPEGQNALQQIGFYNFIYELYSRDLSEKIKSGVTVCMKKGTYSPGCAPYGYKKTEDGKGMEVDREAAAVIRRVFKEVAAGKTAEQVAKELNREKVPTRLRYKQSKGEQRNRCYSQKSVWDRNKIYALVHNEVYAGDKVHRKSVRPCMGSRQRLLQPRDKWIILLQHHEAVVSRELFDRANRRIRARKSGRPGGCRTAGLPVYCGFCLHKLEFRRTAEPYYRCRTARVEDGACGHVRIAERQIRDAVRAVFELYIYLSGTQAPVKKEADTAKLRRERVKKSARLAVIKGEQAALYEDYRRGVLKREAYLKRKAGLREEAEDLDVWLKELKNRTDALGRRELSGVDGADSRGEGFRVPDEWLWALVEKVYVYEDGRLGVVWGFADLCGEGGAGRCGPAAEPARSHASD